MARRDRSALALFIASVFIAIALQGCAGLDPGLRQQFGYETRTAEFAPVLAALNARVASRASAGCVRGAPGIAAAVAPRVYVGTADSGYAPAEGELQQLPHDRFAPMILRLERPTAAWRTAVGAEIARNAVPYAIAIQLGVSQYGKGYSGASRKKVVLGTRYRQTIKFLTAEDKPVEVLHLTGVLVDAERVFDAAELQRVLSSERRDELPGVPPKLEVAVDNLVAQLTRGTVQVPAR